MPDMTFRVVHYQDIWGFRLNNHYFGPFRDRQAAIDAAFAEARRRRAEGRTVEVLIQGSDGGFRAVPFHQQEERAGARRSA
ncbi:hypothetical protein QNA08_11880 [Chelatococcus sp. SYSU_G07232]|uniref:DUF2188 domain-containing protein n=1 Tax=Chelatococcus albus TaxID=3047466 RepID=A0ABT7AIM6_9HYPH|nr:hypothetical protein [Chelatococcus sp. SYSU_G07232]MDJ1158935.1 hypothetical protein [Chelatococcus sp. SYSU_G07232]